MVPTGGTNTFLTSERGKPIYCSKKWPKMSGHKVSVIERFHCIVTNLDYCLGSNCSAN